MLRYVDARELEGSYVLTNELGEVEEDIPLTGYIDSDGVVNVDEHPWSLAHTQGNMFTDLAIRARGLTTQVGFGGLSGTSPMQKMMGGAKRAMSDEYSRRHKKQAAGGGGKPFVQQRVRGGLLSTSSSARL